MPDIGCAQADITAFKHGVGMMGYVKTGQIATDVETPLAARAFVVREGATRLAFVSADMCFVTSAVKRGVVDRLAARHPEGNWTDATVMLTATHTHSGPGGYSQYVFYNASVPGFVPEVYTQIVEGIVEAILEADRRAVPAAMRLASGEFGPEAPVAFNRSLAAYNANPEVVKRSPDEAHLAVDREMTLLRLDALDGRPLGAFNWFATHATSVHSDNHRVTPDHKGYAARAFESAESPGFVAGFCQGASGDVTPNFKHYPGKVGPRGAFEDDFESARHVAKLQLALATALHAQSASAPALSPTLDAGLMWVNFSDVAIPSDLANGEAGHRTSHAAIGARMLEGTAEGPGIPAIAGAFVRSVSALACAVERAAASLASPEARERVEAKYRAHGNKVIFAEMGVGRVLSTQGLVLSMLPGWVDQTVGHLKAMSQKGGVAPGEPWTPDVLPVQIFVFGELAIAAVPGEPTTTAGRRLRRTIETALASRGVTRVILSCYANAYSGYVTTPEEYDCQAYEGASTHFGRWTLAAYQSAYRDLAAQLLKPAHERDFTTGATPRHRAPAELEAIRHGAIAR
jgi:neutral ceramidase